MCHRAVLWSRLNRFVIPLRVGAANRSSYSLIVCDGLVLNVAAAKDTRLQLLVLELLHVESRGFQRRRGLIWFASGVSPVDVLSHEARVVHLVVGIVLPVAIVALSIELLHELLSARSTVLLNRNEFRRNSDVLIMRARLVHRVLLAKQNFGALRITDSACAAAVVRIRLLFLTKNLALEGGDVSRLHCFWVLLFADWSVAPVSVGIADGDLSFRNFGRVLHSFLLQTVLPKHV